MPPATAVWAVPAFTRGEVDRAGRLLAQNGVADPLAIGHALDVINNWRSSHSFPLNTFQMTLRNRAAAICGDPIVARRLKRDPSIFAKLRRFPTMKLSQMQDIGGARAVLPSLAEIEALRDLYRHRMKHRFAGEKDYVRHPKASTSYIAIAATKRKPTTDCISSCSCAAAASTRGRPPWRLSEHSWVSR